MCSKTIPSTERLLAVLAAVADHDVMHDSVVLVQLPTTTELHLAWHAHQTSPWCPFKHSFAVNFNTTTTEGDA